MPTWISEAFGTPEGYNVRVYHIRTWVPVDDLKVLVNEDSGCECNHQIERSVSTSEHES